MTAYRPRLVDHLLSTLLHEVPAVFLTGPRASGKTTSARRRARTVVQLDRPAERAAFEADPDAALRGLDEPVLLDEWQAAPGVLGAVKRAIDSDPRPGRFVLTGSVRAELEQDLWPGTGRVVRVPLLGMTLREQLGLASADTLFDRIATGRGLTPPPDPPDLRGYVGLALRSGFPEPTLRLSAAARERWLESYVEQLLTRDVAAIAPRRDPSRLRRYFEAYALNSAGVVDERTLFDAAGVNRRTALAYEDLLERLHVAEPLPAWSSNRLSRLVRSPKRYVTDPALIAAALGTDTEGVLRDGDLLGRVLDTFVASQLRPELTVSAARPRLHHVRDHGGRHEIDLVAEVGAHDVVATEIKATAAPGRGDAKHLAWLRDRIGARFKVGIVFHTGPRAYSLGERLTAVPIAALWAEG